ncbi:hypothetical protein HSX37_16355|uniref:Uncharacterized protein n=1 Tax=Dendrosporobacter quercicolus TaxID=146817 RepID=A0A1G9ZT60_9FIRM|nr:hypothetical protein [Dendrosporobacter quercicolus]NSL49609.1 hypothetical protein [Dendrosporobacter quercicolus DSM 1736]SDN24792.1 hypothetical protein SAMN04488502_11565 [Dendrosporobacter quercicolus]
MNDIQQQFDSLVTLYGPERVRAAARKLLEISTQRVPAEYIQVLAPEALEDTTRQISFAYKELCNAINHRIAVDQTKGELLQQKIQLESAVKLTEAEAFMNAQGEGKEQYGMIGDKKILLNNEANRDAYRRAYSAADRQVLAETSGEIAAIDVDLARASDVLTASSARVHAIAAKSNLQAALFNFLSGGRGNG